MNWVKRYILSKKHYASEELYKHPITGNGLCGKPGGCSECAKHVSFLQRLKSTPLFASSDTSGVTQGRSDEEHMSAHKQILDGLQSASHHFMANLYGHMPKGPTQHLAGVLDKLKGIHKFLSIMQPSGISKENQQQMNKEYTQHSPLDNYAGGKGFEETNFEEDGGLGSL